MGEGFINSCNFFKPLEWAVGFLFGNTQLSLEFWNVIAGISGLKVGDPPRGRTGNLLIKSYSVDVFRRVIQCCPVLQLNLRTLPQQQAVNRGKLGTIFWNE